MSEKSHAAKTGKYVYAIVPARTDSAYDFPGIFGEKVYAIVDGEVAAVVSDVKNERIRPERRNLAAQQAVLRALMTGPALLPMTFGVIANDRKGVQRILARYQDSLVKQLQRVTDMVEMGLRVSWDVPNIFDFFVNTHQELRQARDRLLIPGRRPSREDKIELGRLFDRYLTADRKRYTQQIKKMLSSYCSDIKNNRCLQENRIMNLACLIARKDQEAFESAVVKAADLFDNNFCFDYNGPWAPHNFVELEFNQ